MNTMQGIARATKNTLSKEPFVLLLLGGFFGLAVLQTTSAQDTDKGPDDKQQIEVKVEPFTEINPSGDVTITINPGEGTNENGNFTGAATSSYKVTTNEGGKISVGVTDNNYNATEELRSLTVLSSGTSAPGDELTVDSDLALISDGSPQGINELASPDNDYGVVGTGDITFEAAVTPQFDPGSKATVEVVYTMTAN
ncbi:hypothetical protein [Salinibacter ruber]|uniref:hypothetical protein n=1 Tax=Salinibacter ruber TaxID=146919 RepID=UPI002073E4A4|nr:hypothetical protein [Salinibacter ruber]